MSQASAAKKFGLISIGNAIVDILAPVGDDFLTAQAVTKGSYILLNQRAEADAFGALLTPEREVPGGSVANTLAGFVSFGGTGAFVGKIADDRLGQVLRTDLATQGIHYATPPCGDEAGTGRGYIMMTPDKERTCAMYLGANDTFSEADIDVSLIAQAQIVLFEGYMYDRPGAPAAFNKAAAAARAAGAKVAFTLSDSNCVTRHRQTFLDFIGSHVDILLGNEKEAKALAAKSDFNDAAVDAAKLCEIAILTQGGKGARILTQAGAVQVHVPCAPVKKLVDTTGAGDAFAAGTLYGLSVGLAPEAAGALGARAAAEVISHVGARPPGVKFSALLSPQ